MSGVRANGKPKARMVVGASNTYFQPRSNFRCMNHAITHNALHVATDNTATTLTPHGKCTTSARIEINVKTHSAPKMTAYLGCSC